MIIRIDDYPTGIRPILSDHIKELGPILYKFENAKIHYFLGIVPALCVSKDWSFLNSLKYMIPACHGYDHLYPLFHTVLLEKNDPYNETGYGGSENEFRGLGYSETYRRITEGIDILRKNILRNTYTFIPPYNRINEHTENILEKNQITLVLGEIPSLRNILTISSGSFYIWSNQTHSMDLKKAQCITLHLTWEWDLIRKGNNYSLEKLIKRIKDEL